LIAINTWPRWQCSFLCSHQSVFFHLLVGWSCFSFTMLNLSIGSYILLQRK